MKNNLSLFLLITGLLIGLSSCKKDEDGVSCELIPFNAFTLAQDKELGMQVAAGIAADPKNYPILSESQYPASYAYIRKIRDNILNSGKVTNKSSFDWPVYIIKDDKTLNAFCTPGGYIFVYTGLIKFLDTEDDLAGVLGHEIAHADKRHSS
ncbi:MAG: peptidase M48, partial [Chitinophagia bacterium]|nr:peptidase M48 [Chitinophagia bacterium]